VLEVEEMNGIILLTVVGYFALVLYIGARASKLVKNAEDYIVAGRNLGFLVFMILVISSIMSGMTVLGSSGLAYLTGWPSMWEPIFVCLSVAVLMIVFGAKLHRLSSKHGYNSVQDYLAHRFESPRTIRLIAAIAAIAISFIYLVGQFRAISIVLTWLFDLPNIVSLLIGCAVITIYVLLGGLYAVAHTTMVQGLCLLIGCVFVIPPVIQAAGGLTQINQTLSAVDPNLVALAYPQAHPPVESYGFLTPLFLVSFFFLLSFGLAAAPHTLNNILSARRYTYFRWLPALAFFVYIVVFFLIKFGGFAARTLVIQGKFQVPHPDYALIAAIEHSLPPVVWAFFAVVVLAAVMSTTDRLLLTIGTLFSWDIYKRIFAQEASDDRIRAISRRVVVITSGLAFVLAINPPALLAWLIWMGIGLILSTFCVPLLAGLYWRGATREGGIAAMVFGFGSAVAAGYVHEFVVPLPFHFSLVGFAVSLVAMITVSICTSRTSDSVLAATETGLHF